MRRIFRLVAFLFLIGCSTVPITGRKQLSFIPQGQLLTLSDQSYQQVLSQSKISTDAAQTQEVVEVGLMELVAGVVVAVGVEFVVVSGSLREL